MIDSPSSLFQSNYCPECGSEIAEPVYQIGTVTVLYWCIRCQEYLDEGELDGGEEGMFPSIEEDY